MSLNNNNEEEKEERIYIGGVQPPKLTVEMVQKRMASSLADQIDFVSFDTVQSRTAKNNDPWGRGDDAATFFFATVRNKEKKEHSDDVSSCISRDQPRQHHGTSPLDIIAKHYHNVKWKGCSLRVEKAKLHILKRLEQERMEVLDRQSTQISPLVQEVTTSGPSTESMGQKSFPCDHRQGQKIKRHLRIKRRFGEEAYLVDTKPIQTNNYKDFHVAFKKLKNKRKKLDSTSLENGQLKRRSDSNESSLQSKKFLNRAIHIVFENEDVVGDNDHSDTNDDVSKTSDTDRLLERYEWSDSNDSDATKDSDTSEDSHAMVNSDSSVLVNVHAIHGEKDHQEELQQTRVESPDSYHSGRYVWSDSDDNDTDNGDDDDYKEGDNIDRQHDETWGAMDYKNQSKHGNLDEFASELNESSFIPLTKSGEMNSDKHDGPDFQETGISLEEDVRMNMKMAIQLFPELSRVQPVTFDAGGEQTSQEVISSGWDTVGQMKRYDPFASTASRYEIKEVQSNIHDKESNVESKGEDDDTNECDRSTEKNKTSVENNSSVATSTVMPKTPHMTVDEMPKQQIYQQQKLEQVFQQGRNSQGTTGFQMSSLFEQSLLTNESSRLSGQTQSFSFGFVPEEKENSCSTTRDENEEETSRGREMTSGNITEMTQMVPEPVSKTSWTLKKRAELSFTDEEINVLVEKFYRANEGIAGLSAIMENPKLMEEDNKKWEEERKSLTIDWKRKHKQAKTFKKKKFKSF